MLLVVVLFVLEVFVPLYTVQLLVELVLRDSLDYVRDKKLDTISYYLLTAFHREKVCSVTIRVIKQINFSGKFMF